MQECFEDTGNIAELSGLATGKRFGRPGIQGTISREHVGAQATFHRHANFEREEPVAKGALAADGEPIDVEIFGVLKESGRCGIVEVSVAEKEAIGGQRSIVFGDVQATAGERRVGQIGVDDESGERNACASTGVADHKRHACPARGRSRPEESLLPLGQTRSIALGSQHLSQADIARLFVPGFRDSLLVEQDRNGLGPAFFGIIEQGFEGLVGVGSMASAEGKNDQSR